MKQDHPRTSIQVPGFGHGDNPIPAASRTGNVVISGALFGIDLSTGKMPDGLDDQCKNMFVVAKRVLEAAGASFDNVARMTVFIRPGLSREAINREWVAAFPQASSRPARHTIVNGNLPENVLVQCDVFAIVPDGGK